jgi:hypothetical protein
MTNQSLPKFILREETYTEVSINESDEIAIAQPSVSEDSYVVLSRRQLKEIVSQLAKMKSKGV